MGATEAQQTIGEVVRERREELGMSKAELARRARLTRSSIHEIELDQRSRLQAKTLRALEEALALTPGALPSSRVYISHTTGEVLKVESLSLRSELELALSERRYNSLLDLIMKVADRLDELEERVERS